jgi:hypothetical protein
LAYQKTFFPSRFTIGSNFLGYTENNGVHRMDSKEKVKQKVYPNPLEIVVFSDNLSRYCDLIQKVPHDIGLKKVF